MTRRPRIALLGGTFNPPHLGHLKLAQLAWQFLELDELRFLPAANPPHKQLPKGSPEIYDRVGLLKTLLEGQPFSIDLIEIEHGGNSFTYETLEMLSKREPEMDWIWIAGSDQLALLKTWKHWERILELSSLAVSPRPGWSNELPEGLGGCLRVSWSGSPGEIVWLPSTGLNIASSKFRQELAKGCGNPELLKGLSSTTRAAISRENFYRLN